MPCGAFGQWDVDGVAVTVAYARLVCIAVVVRIVLTASTDDTTTERDKRSRLRMTTLQASNSCSSIERVLRVRLRADDVGMGME